MSVSDVVPPGATASPRKTRPVGDVVLLTCNDLHLSDVAPASRLDNYVDEVFDLLGQIAQVAEKLQADAVCIAGDIFHSKDRPMGSALLGRLVDWCKRLQANGTDVLIIPGNHDLRYNNLDTLPTQPLGLMLKADVMRDVSVDPMTYWITADTGVTVLGVPFPYAMDLAEWKRYSYAKGLTKQKLVVLAHCFASMSGGMVYNEPEHAYMDLFHACPADVYVFGHDHSDGKVTQVYCADGPSVGRSAYFVNLGAISRGTIGVDDITRDIHLGIVRIGADIKVQRVKLNARPASELFDLTAKAEQTVESKRIETFIADLEVMLASLDSSAPVATHLGALTISDAVKARMQRYIDSVEQG